MKRQLISGVVLIVVLLLGTITLWEMNGNRLVVLDALRIYPKPGLYKVSQAVGPQGNIVRTELMRLDADNQSQETLAVKRYLEITTNEKFDGFVTVDKFGATRWSLDKNTALADYADGSK